MSYNAYACSIWTIPWDKVKELVPTEAENFENMCEELYEDCPDPIADFAIDTAHYQEDKDTGAYLALQNAFEAKTGLRLSLGWIPSDADSDVSGAIWQIENAVELTPAAKVLANSLHFQTWVEFG